MPDFLNYYGPGTATFVDPSRQLERGQQQLMDSLGKHAEQQEVLRREALALQQSELARSRISQAAQSPWARQMMGDLQGGPMAMNLDFGPGLTGEQVAQGAYNSAGIMAPALGLRAPPTHPLDPGLGAPTPMGSVVPEPVQGPWQGSGVEARENFGGMTLSRTPMAPGVEPVVRSPMYDPESDPLAYPQMAQQAAPMRAAAQPRPMPQRQVFQGPRTPEELELYRYLQSQKTQLDITRESTTNRATMQNQKLEKDMEKMKVTIGQKLVSDLSRQTTALAKIKADGENLKYKLRNAPPKAQKSVIEDFRKRVDEMRKQVKDAETNIQTLLFNGVYSSDPGSPGYDRFMQARERVDEMLPTLQEATADYETAFSQIVGGGARPTQRQQLRETTQQDDVAKQIGAMSDEELRKLVGG